MRKPQTLNPNEDRIKTDSSPSWRKYRNYSNTIIFLFFLLSVYLVLPFVDIPFLGLSFSAPVFFLIAMQALIKPPEPWFKLFQKWIFLSGLIWLGISISTIGNGLISSGVAIDTEGWISLIQYAYWLLVFVVTAYFASRGKILERVAGVLGWAVFGLGLVRLFEAAVWGNIGSGYGTELVSQNGYGFLFSSFFPFLIEPIIYTRGPKRLFMMMRLLICGLAVVLNGSRGSWISVAIGILAFSVLYLLTSPKKLGWSLLILILSASTVVGLQAAPSEVTAAFEERLGTFNQLEGDKSYVFREVMVQKGWKLFNESPLIGVGASRFRKESTFLELSGVFSYYSQINFDNKSAHNSYIMILAETGLVGSLPFAILLIMLVFGSLKTSMNDARKNQIWALSVFASFVGMSIHMWTVSALTGTSTWFVYGLVAGMIEQERQHHADMTMKKSNLSR